MRLRQGESEGRMRMHTDAPGCARMRMRTDADAPECARMRPTARPEGGQKGRGAGQGGRPEGGRAGGQGKWVSGQVGKWASG